MKLTRTICTLIFGLAALMFFGLAYPHHLHYQEQNQLFLFDSAYMWEIVKMPGGTADLLGRFCTQFFLFAWVGAFIIALLLAVVQMLTLKVASWGRLYALSFVPAFLLWLFLLDENALLGGLWAVLLTLLAHWCFGKVADGRMRRILLMVAVPALYWIAGPVCVVFFLLQLPIVGGGEAPKQQGAGRGASSKKSLWSVGALAFLAIMVIALSFYIPVAPGRLFYGIHYHRYPTVIPYILWAAALSVVVLTLIVRACRRWAVAELRPVAAAVSFVVLAAIMGTLVWKNCNFKAEKVMKYDFMARHQQWNRILQTISDEKPNNQIGVTVQNLALAMRGMLADHMFEYHQNGTLGLLPDVGTDATSPLPTAEAFYQLGMTTVAQRTVFEAQEAILDFQKSARCYKRLAQTNLIVGSYEVARKYLMALKKTMFYSDWADETLKLLGDEKAIAKHPEYGRMRQMAYKENFFFGDRVTPDMLKSLFLSNQNNKLAYEYLMAEYLLTGDLDNFAGNVALGEKLGYEATPRHFQEALALKWGLRHEKDEVMPAQVGPEVAQRFKQFYSYVNSPAMTPEGMRQYFGDTYWFYYFNSLKP